MYMVMDAQHMIMGNNQMTSKSCSMRPLYDVIKASSMHPLTSAPYYKLECHDWFHGQGPTKALQFIIWSAS